MFSDIDVPSSCPDRKWQWGQCQITPCFEQLRDNKRARGTTRGVFISCVMLNILIVIKNAWRCRGWVHTNTVQPSRVPARHGSGQTTLSPPSCRPSRDAGSRGETVSALLANMSRCCCAAKNMLLPKLGLCPTVTLNCKERSHIINIIWLNFGEYLLNLRGINLIDIYPCDLLGFV